MPSKAVFLDRDGTVIKHVPYLDNVEEVELTPGAGQALRRLQDRGYTLVLVTNQSGVGRGYYELDVVEAQHARLAELLAPYGVSFAGVYICPHAPDAACDCRKPLPGMLLRAATELDLDLNVSWMIGDNPSDVGAGEAAGCRALLLDNPETPDAPDLDTLPDLAAAIDFIMNEAIGD